MRRNLVAMTITTITLAYASQWAIGDAAGGEALAPDDRAALLLDWPLDGGLSDMSGNGHDGTAVGEPAFEMGREGAGSLSLHGDGAYVTADTALPELTDTFAIECWVNPAPTQRPYADILGNHANEFVGFALQQDGEQANRYYFTYGTGATWVYSKTVALEPDTWQHVAIAKSTDRLRFYVNGVLVDSRPAPQPMAPSQTPFMVGLGIAGQERWFSGKVAQVRVRRVARRPSIEVSAEVQAEWFARSATVERAASSRWYLFPPDEPGNVTFRLDGEEVPEAVESVRIAFSAEDMDGHEAPFAPPLLLSRANGFSGTVSIPMEPGTRRVSMATEAGFVGGATSALQPDSFTYRVLATEDTCERPPRAERPTVPATVGSRVMALDGEWLIATDPDNKGRDEGWFRGPIDGAVKTRVPWIIQGPFPGYHGLAWYWRTFEAPAIPHPGGRALLRFEAVDYKADVWVNGEPVGGHEGGEGPFELDITPSLRPGAENLIAVRVLNPTHEAIDGIRLNEAPRRAKVIPYSAGASYDHGGIVGAVQLALVPQVYVRDLYLRPNVATGRIHVEAMVHNAGSEPVEASIRLDVAPATSGEALDSLAWQETVPVGVHTLATDLRVDGPRLWDLADPYLYRVTARVEAGASFDERSDRCGFRDFRFAGGYFRLNGRRIFLRSTHTCNATPVGQQVPGDPSLFQRDLVLLKTMGFNCIRFIWGGATKRQLDMCDELGLLVYDEHAASNPIQDNPKMAERFDRSVTETILRDRNHPSVALWGLLNETQDGPVFNHALGMLPLVRSLDETRVVMLNSGRWDGRWDIGSLCNPGSPGWEPCLGGEREDAGTSRWGPAGGYFEQAGDAHVYPRVPHTAETIELLKTLGEGTGHVFLSEYGIGSAVDLWRVTRHFEALGAENAEDAQYYRSRLDRFLADFAAWRLDECFADPQAFFAASLRKMAGQRTLGLDAIRANPSIIGYSLTGMMDHVNCGEGLFTLFRELKPGTTDALFEGLAPLRLCLFAEPHNVCLRGPVGATSVATGESPDGSIATEVAPTGGTVKLQAVLANEDALPPGDYPVRIQVIGPDMSRVLDETVTLAIPTPETPFALPVFEREIELPATVGEYRFLATMLRGGAPTGGETGFVVIEPNAQGLAGAEVTLWGDDADLTTFLEGHGARVRRFDEGPADHREVILVVGKPATGDDAAAWRDLATRIARGGTAVFLMPEALARGDQPTGWLPLREKGTLRGIFGWLYLKDEWAKTHPIFASLPAGGLMDYGIYRDIIPDLVFSGQEPPAEAVSGAIKASQDYDSGLMLAVYPFAAGRFALSTLRIRENLGRDPVADQLLLNLVRWSADTAAGDLLPAPADLDAQLAAVGY